MDSSFDNSDRGVRIFDGKRGDDKFGASIAKVNVDTYFKAEDEDKMGL